jgi:hypothetical protein
MIMIYGGCGGVYYLRNSIWGCQIVCRCGFNGLALLIVEGAWVLETQIISYQHCLGEMGIG